MDQSLIAALSLVAFMGFGVFAYIFNEERKSRRRTMNIHSGPDNVETRARRAF
jgi:hypothetical protein